MPSRWAVIFDSTFNTDIIGNLITFAEPQADDTTEAREELERLICILQYSKVTLDSFIKEFITDSAKTLLANINNNCTNIQTYLNEYRNTKGIGSLQQANSEVDQLLSSIKPFEYFKNDANAHEFGQLIRRTKEYSESFKDSTDKALALLENKITSFEQALSQQETRLTTLITNFTTDSQAETANAKSSLHSAINTIDSEWQAAMTQMKSVHNTLISEMTAQREKNETLLKKEESERLAKYEEYVKRVNDEIEVTSSFTQAQLEELDDFIKSKTDEAENIIGILSNKSQTGHYQKYANSEFKISMIFRILSLLVMGFSAWIIYRLSITESPDWFYSAQKILSSTIIFIPAVYMAREASYHSRLEKNYRKRQLEFATFDPFLNTLEKEERNEIKKGLSEKLFGQADEPIVVDKDEIGSKMAYGTLIDIVKMLIKKQ